MIQVAVLSSDPSLTDVLRAAGLRAGAMDPAGLEATEPPTASALVVDVRGGQPLPAALPSFRRRNPGIGVVLVASSLDPRLMLEAMRAGVNECVQEPLSGQVLDEAVRRVLVDAPPDQAGQVFAFVGAKGGVGATTIAVNTAASLARGHRGEVLFIDLHVGHGDAALFLGVEPRFSVVDALENVQRVDESFFGGLVEKTKAGVDLLASSDRIVAGATDPQRLDALLGFAVRKYRFTVLDVPRTDPSILDALERATSTVIVTSQELPSLRSAGRLAHSLRARYGTSRVKAVMNRFDSRVDIAHADVERVIGGPVRHLVPSQYRAAIEALNVGRPVALDDGRLASAFRALARDLSGATKTETQRPAGVLGRLAFRRA